MKMRNCDFTDHLGDLDVAIERVIHLGGALVNGMNHGTHTLPNEILDLFCDADELTQAMLAITPNLPNCIVTGITPEDGAYKFMGRIIRWLDDDNKLGFLVKCSLPGRDHLTATMYTKTWNVNRKHVKWFYVESLPNLINDPDLLRAWIREVDEAYKAEHLDELDKAA